MERLLVLARHGQSEWNLKNLFTGWRDPGLTERGVDEARAAGRALKQAGYGFDIAFTSELVRAQRTCALMLEEMGLPDLDVQRSQALNERDYGDLAGSTRTMPAPNGARSRSTSGDAPTTCGRPAVKA